MKRWLVVLSFTLCALAVCVAPAQAILIGPFTGTWDGSEPLQTGRIIRNGVPSDGTGSKLWPGTFDLNPQGFDVFRFRNAGPQGVVTIDVTVSNVDTHVSAYLGTDYFTLYPLNGPNYLGDVGASVSQPFSILVPMFSDFTVVANTNFGLTTALGQTYSFTVSGDSVESVPEPGTLVLLGAGLATLWARRRRSSE